MNVTALNQTHRDQGGKMVEFAGYEMPIQYSEGMLKEHEWTRSGNVGLFDVSHMGQYIMEGENVPEFLSDITPSNFIISKPSVAKYTVLTNPEGGIIDDLIITKINDNKFFIVLNAACKEKDESWIRKNLPENITFSEIPDRSLIAIQGGKAEASVEKLLDSADLSELPYMNLGVFKLLNGTEIFVSRTGYTGEDGFEVSIPNTDANKFWLDLCEQEAVKPIGLGARDSLRLEMGYPLYGNDLDETTSPIDAGLGWVVSKSNPSFFGSDRILKEKAEGSSRKRIGVKLLDRGIAREGAEVRKDGQKIGVLSSGGFSPNLKVSIGQGYFDPNIVKIGDKISVVVRNKEIPAELTSVTFIEAKTKSAKKQ